MLSDKLISYFKEREIWFDDDSDSYRKVLEGLNIPVESTFYEFFMKVDDGATYYSRKFEIYNICWFMLNSDDLKLLMENLWINRPDKQLPKNYIPFSPFEAEKVLLYDINTDYVYFVNEQEINNIINGIIKSEYWNSFNEFLEWFFELN